jgi:hypothetical protein
MARNWTPSGQGPYFVPEDVDRLAEWLEEVRNNFQLRDELPQKQLIRAEYEDGRGRRIEVYLCDSCGFAVDRGGHCQGCTGLGQGR